MGSWSVDGSNLSLSTMKSNNILVTSSSKSEIMEYTTSGTVVRTVPLPQSMINPYHAIQVDNDRFLVSHASTSLHRVAVIDKHRTQ